MMIPIFCLMQIDIKRYGENFGFQLAVENKRVMERMDKRTRRGATVSLRSGMRSVLTPVQCTLPNCFCQGQPDKFQPLAGFCAQSDMLDSTILITPITRAARG